MHAKILHHQGLDDKDHVIGVEAQWEQGAEVGDSVKGTITPKAVGHGVQCLHDSWKLLQLSAHVGVALASAEVPKAPVRMQPPKNMTVSMSTWERVSMMTWHHVNMESWPRYVDMESWPHGIMSTWSHGHVKSCNMESWPHGIMSTCNHNNNWLHGNMETWQPVTWSTMSWHAINDKSMSIMSWHVNGKARVPSPHVVPFAQQGLDRLVLRHGHFDHCAVHHLR